MNWNVFEYAGPTALAWTALWTSAVVLVAFTALFGWLLWRGARRGATLRCRLACLGIPVACVVTYLCAWRAFGPVLDRAWRGLQTDVRRRSSTYTMLTFASAFLPPAGEAGRHAFVHLATRDSGFASGKPISAEKVDGRVIARYEDEDYPGGVVTMDGRPVDTGFRFRPTRRLPALIALAERPAARTVRVAGAEAAFCTNVFAEAGLKVLPQDDGKTPADIVFVAPLPDWMVGSDMPDAEAWKRLAEGLATNGVAALRLDGRLLSRARLKGILADFRAAFTHYRMWCVGLHDYVVTSGGDISASDVLELFSRQEPFEAFVKADVYIPAELFACYMGTDYEIEPGLLEIPAITHADATWSAPHLAFMPQPTNHLAEVQAIQLTPYYIPPTRWFTAGTTLPEVWSRMTNQIIIAQGVRREILLGYAEAARGASTNAIERWAAAAKGNPRDPLLGNQADELDLEGRRSLRLHKMNAALQYYENRLLIRPNDVAAVHNFGVCLKKAGHWDVAARVFTKAVTMDPLTDEHRYEMIEACAAAGLEDVATRQLDVLIKRHPEDPALKMRAARLLASRSNKVRDTARAISLAEEAVRLTGWKDRSYVHGLADVYIAAGREVMGVGLKRKMKTMRFER